MGKEKIWQISVTFGLRRQPYQTPRSLQRRGGRGDGDQHLLSAAGACTSSRNLPAPIPGRRSSHGAGCW
jgi:hypothetical protein